MKTSRQLNALIRNMAKDKSINAQIILRNFMLERLLERISLSPYRENLILKGGMCWSRPWWDWTPVLPWTWTPR